MIDSSVKPKPTIFLGAICGEGSEYPEVKKRPYWLSVGGGTRNVGGN